MATEAEESAIDDLLDEVLTTDRDEKEEEEEEVVEAVEDDVSSDEEGGDYAEESEVVPPSEDEADVEAEVGAEADDSIPGDDSEESASANSDKEKGLLREIAQLRQKISTLASEPQPTAQQQAPPPAETTAPNVEDMGIGVKISEDGTRAYVDPSALREAVQREAMEVNRRASQPTARDLMLQANSRAVESFVNEDESNKIAVEKAKNVDDFLSLKIQELMSQGHRFTSVSDAIESLRVSGVIDQVEQSVPELKGMTEEFIASMSTGEPLVRVGVMRRIRERMGASEAAGVRPGLKSVTNAPKSMSKKGGSRSSVSEPVETEFKQLESEFRENIVGFPQKDFDRLQRLGRQLGKPGF